MPREDIFNEYAKIAIKNGIVKVADKKTNKTRLEYSGSEAIQVLYGLKPDSNNSIEYEKNISEYAHPNSVVVSPAHDKINGLVENINERQNIILNIINDPVNGHLNQRRYAQSELVASLVRVANYMDNKDQEELRILADACLDGIRKNADSFWEKVMNTGSNIKSKMYDLPEYFSGFIFSLWQGIKGAMVGATAGAGAYSVLKFVRLFTKAVKNPSLLKNVSGWGAAAGAFMFAKEAYDQLQEINRRLDESLNNAINYASNFYASEGGSQYGADFIPKMIDCMKEFREINSKLLSEITSSPSDDDCHKAAKLKKETRYYLDKYFMLHDQKKLFRKGRENENLYESMVSVMGHLNEVNDLDGKVEKYFSAINDSELQGLLDVRNKIRTQSKPAEKLPEKIDNQKTKEENASRSVIDPKPDNKQKQEAKENTQPDVSDYF